ncbi:hypothetical protein RHSIM_Rhsim10G0197600 [Rhododendron simsii]|uniref:Pentatricopeptide repeat-containing protein n=1 Tax=Rhododendron simsii TaxID=118357 RepID=A0A834LDR2_RHOSS|nr:hypothetical protein RHSIM_Rhsim10G0197600 [Rhododendron simsii]
MHCSIQLQSWTGQQVHGIASVSGLDSDPFVQSSLVLYMSNQMQSIKDVHKLLDAMSERDVVSWSALFSGYAQLGHGSEARESLSQVSPTLDSFKVFFFMVALYTLHCSKLWLPQASGRSEMLVPIERPFRMLFMLFLDPLLIATVNSLPSRRHRGDGSRSMAGRRSLFSASGRNGFSTKVSSGQSTLYWKDVWFGHAPIMEVYPRLHLISTQQSASDLTLANSQSSRAMINGRHFPRPQSQAYLEKCKSFQEKLATTSELLKRNFTLQGVLEEGLVLYPVMVRNSKLLLWCCLLGVDSESRWMLAGTSSEYRSTIFAVV